MGDVQDEDACGRMEENRLSVVTRLWYGEEGGRKRRGKVHLGEESSTPPTAIHCGGHRAGAHCLHCVVVGTIHWRCACRVEALDAVTGGDEVQGRTAVHGHVENGSSIFMSN